MNDRLIFGLIIPGAIFLISLIATFLIYRHFTRPGSSICQSEQKRSKDNSK
ncbi:MAG: hypothetical protein N3B16_10065 [Candidatus Aminicenantes bacterium]|nr:hypothetical protein [Candidatus Aminicenantes bacterium]